MVAMQLGKLGIPSNTLLPVGKVSLHEAKIVPHIIKFLSFEPGVPPNALGAKTWIFLNLRWSQIGLCVPSMITLVGQ